jgi:hypothetical protein
MSLLDIRFFVWCNKKRLGSKRRSRVLASKLCVIGGPLHPAVYEESSLFLAWTRWMNGVDFFSERHYEAVSRVFRLLPTVHHFLLSMRAFMTSDRYAQTSQDECFGFEQSGGGGGEESHIRRSS